MKSLIKNRIFYVACLFLTACFLFFTGIAFAEKNAAAETAWQTEFIYEKGASIRIDPEGNTSGIRFTARFNESVYDKIVHDGTIKENAELGMIIVPDSYVRDYEDSGYTDYFTYFEKVKNKTKAQISTAFQVNQMVSVGNNTYQVGGALINVKETNFNRAFRSIMYYTVDGGEKYTYQANEDARCITDVSVKAIQQEKTDGKSYTAAQLGVLYGYTNGEIPRVLFDPSKSNVQEHGISLVSAGNGTEAKVSVVKQGIEPLFAVEVTATADEGKGAFLVSNTIEYLQTNWASVYNFVSFDFWTEAEGVQSGITTANLEGEWQDLEPSLSQQIVWTPEDLLWGQTNGYHLAFQNLNVGDVVYLSAFTAYSDKSVENMIKTLPTEGSLSLEEFCTVREARQAYANLQGEFSVSSESLERLTASEKLSLVLFDASNQAEYSTYFTDMVPSLLGEEPITTLSKSTFEGQDWFTFTFDRTVEEVVKNDDGTTTAERYCGGLYSYSMKGIPALSGNFDAETEAALHTGYEIVSFKIKGSSLNSLVNLDASGLQVQLVPVGLTEEEENEYQLFPAWVSHDEMYLYIYAEQFQAWAEGKLALFMQADESALNTSVYIGDFTAHNLSGVTGEVALDCGLFSELSKRIDALPTKGMISRADKKEAADIRAFCDLFVNAGEISAEYFYAFLPNYDKLLTCESLPMVVYDAADAEDDTGLAVRPQEGFGKANITREKVDGKDWFKLTVTEQGNGYIALEYQIPSVLPLYAVDYPEPFTPQFNLRYAGLHYEMMSSAQGDIQISTGLCDVNSFTESEFVPFNGQQKVSASVASLLSAVMGSKCLLLKDVQVGDSFYFSSHYLYDASGMAALVQNLPDAASVSARDRAEIEAMTETLLSMASILSEAEMASLAAEKEKMENLQIALENLPSVMLDVEGEGELMTLKADPITGDGWSGSVSSVEVDGKPYVKISVDQPMEDGSVNFQYGLTDSPVSQLQILGSNNEYLYGTHTLYVDSASEDVRLSFGFDAIGLLTQAVGMSAGTGAYSFLLEGRVLPTTQVGELRFMDATAMLLTTGTLFDSAQNKVSGLEAGDSIYIGDVKLYRATDVQLMMDLLPSPQYVKLSDKNQIMTVKAHYDFTMQNYQDRLSEMEFAFSEESVDKLEACVNALLKLTIDDLDRRGSTELVMNNLDQVKEAWELAKNTTLDEETAEKAMVYLKKVTSALYTELSEAVGDENLEDEIQQIKLLQNYEEPILFYAEVLNTIGSEGGDDAEVDRANFAFALYLISYIFEFDTWDKITVVDGVETTTQISNTEMLNASGTDGSTYVAHVDLAQIPLVEKIVRIVTVDAARMGLDVSKASWLLEALCRGALEAYVEKMPQVAEGELMTAEQIQETKALFGTFYSYYFNLYMEIEIDPTACRNFEKLDTALLRMIQSIIAGLPEDLTAEDIPVLVDLLRYPLFLNKTDAADGVESWLGESWSVLQTRCDELLWKLLNDLPPVEADASLTVDEALKEEIVQLWDFYSSMTLIDFSPLKDTYKDNTSFEDAFGVYAVAAVEYMIKNLPAPEDVQKNDLNVFKANQYYDKLSTAQEDLVDDELVEKFKACYEKYSNG